MFDLIAFIFLVVFLPYIVVGVVLGEILVELAKMFRLRVLFGACSVAGLGVLAWMNATPNPEAEYSTLVEAFSQSHPFGAPMPLLCMGAAALLFVASIRRTEAT